MELSGGSARPWVRLEVDAKLQGAGFPVRPTFEDEGCEIAGQVMHFMAFADEGQNTKELALRAPDLQGSLGNTVGESCFSSS